MLTTYKFLAKAKSGKKVLPAHAEKFITLSLHQLPVDSLALVIYLEDIHTNG
jgi:hypothetical protein